MFALGFLLDAMISVVGLLSMDVVPTHVAGSAHGLATGIAQSMYSHDAWKSICVYLEMEV